MASNFKRKVRCGQKMSSQSRTLEEGEEEDEPIPTILCSKKKGGGGWLDWIGGRMSGDSGFRFRITSLLKKKKKYGVLPSNEVFIDLAATVNPIIF